MALKSLTSGTALHNELLGRPATDVANLVQRVGYAWRRVPVPVLACLHGVCLGGGLQIALGADFRFCTPDCRLAVMEAKWGERLGGWVDALRAVLPACFSPVASRGISYRLDLHPQVSFLTCRRR